MYDAKKGLEEMMAAIPKRMTMAYGVEVEDMNVFGIDGNENWIPVKSPWNKRTPEELAYNKERAKGINEAAGAALREATGEK